MNGGKPDASRDDRFDDVVAEFLDAVEAGSPPNEVEFAARHPEFEQSLLAFFEDYRQMGGWLTPNDQAIASESSSEAADSGASTDGASPPPVDSRVAKTTAFSGSKPTDPRQPTLGDFVLLERIAEGGMGVVYKAKQKGLERIVALKMIRSGQFADDEEVQRFHREAAAAAKLDHPGIVPIYQVGEEDGQHFFAMAYVKGHSLADIIREQRLPPKQAAEYVRKVAIAVHFAHQHGIIHRDIKPGNVLVDELGELKVTDFGLAKDIDSDHSLTTSGQIVGTVSYMPPEQASGTIRRVSTWSDVYSLGALLYALLTQRPPFQAENPLDVLMQVLSDMPIAPSKVDDTKWQWPGRRDASDVSSGSTWTSSKIPLDLDTICLKCLEKEPSKRYPSAESLADDLQRFLEGAPIRARPVRLVERTIRWCRRRKALSTATALALLLLILTPVIVVQGRGLSDSFLTKLKEFQTIRIRDRCRRADARTGTNTPPGGGAILSRRQATTGGNTTGHRHGVGGSIHGVLRHFEASI